MISIHDNKLSELQLQTIIPKKLALQIAKKI